MDYQFASSEFETEQIENNQFIISDKEKALIIAIREGKSQDYIIKKEYNVKRGDGSNEYQSRKTSM